MVRTGEAHGFFLCLFNLSQRCKYIIVSNLRHVEDFPFCIMCKYHEYLHVL